MMKEGNKKRLFKQLNNSRGKCNANKIKKNVKHLSNLQLNKEEANIVERECFQRAIENIPNT